MLADYKDITSRIAESPKWWDSNGVPRYDPFHPDLCPNIYADQVALVGVRCASCGLQFRVELHSDNWDTVYTRPRLDARVRDRTIRYGDPPRHGDDETCAGETMQSDAERVLEFWRSEGGEWQRVSELEVDLEEEAER